MERLAAPASWAGLGLTMSEEGGLDEVKESLRAAASCSGAEPHTTSHAGLRIELIPQPPVATRTSPVPQGEDHCESHVAERQEGEDAGNSAVDPPKEHLEPPEDGNEGEPE